MSVSELERALAAHRALVLRHCYRMLGSYAEAEDLTQETLVRAWRAHSTFEGAASLVRWLLAIATNVCLTALEKRKRRELPQLDGSPCESDWPDGPLEPERWITPVADDRLFPDAGQAAEAKETIALAFVALLQRAPPRQRAALLLKDVLGWTAEEIAGTLELSPAAVHSALHRAREAIANGSGPHRDPDEATLRAFVRAWERRDEAALVALLRDDVTLAMPPWALFFDGLPAVIRFLRSSRFGRFWAAIDHLETARGNGAQAFAFYTRPREGSPSGHLRHSVMVVRFDGMRVAEMTTFLQPRAPSAEPSPFAGFDFS